MTLDMPYFMENDEWYKFDFVIQKYILTDKAPEKAKESYERFMGLLQNNETK